MLSKSNLHQKYTTKNN